MVTNFKSETCPDDLLEIYYFYISQVTNKVEFGEDILQDCVSLYHLYVWFFGEFRQLFCRGLYEFLRRLWFPADMFPLMKDSIAYINHRTCKSGHEYPWSSNRSINSNWSISNYRKIHGWSIFNYQIQQYRKTWFQPHLAASTSHVATAFS